MRASRRVRFAVPAVIAGILSVLPIGTSTAGAVRVEDRSLRTETSNTYRVSAQRFVTRVFANPVNFRDAAGHWQRIDRDLVPSRRRGYALETAATPYRLDLPRALSGPPVHFASGDDWVSFRLEGGAGSARVAATDATARYRGALRGVDLRYDAIGDGVKETLILRDRSAPGSYRFRLATSLGLEPRVAQSGRVDLVRPDGSTAFHFAAPYMEDAAGASSTAVDVGVERRLDGWSMVLRPDAGWLRAGRRAWPVRLDPTVNLGASLECAYIRVTSNAQASVCDGPDFTTTSTGGSVKRSLMRFDVRALPFASVITNATLRLYSSGDHGSVSVHQVQKPWTMHANWHTYDGTRPWSTLGGDYVSSPAATASVANGWASWNVTALTAQWVTARQADDGILLLGQGQGTYRFSTSRRAAVQQPHLQVTFVSEVVPPVLGEPEHQPALADVWVDAEARSVKGAATDVGVGLQQMLLHRPTPTGTATDPQYFKCDTTLSPTCDPDGETMCGGTWDSRCPPTGDKTFDYHTGTLSEGLVRPSLVARDAAANESAARSWQLKVDHSAPQIDEVSGSLYDRRNRTDDHRFEGLYDSQYSVRFRAHDGTDSAPRSGIERMQLEVIAAGGAVVQTDIRDNDACSASGCTYAMDEPFTFDTDSVADGEYTIRLTAVDQLDHPRSQEWQVTVDRRGDIYTARDFDRPPAQGGTAQALERVQLATRDARREMPDAIATRRQVACGWDASRTCSELRRLRLEGDDPAVPASPRLSIRFGTSADDPRLAVVATVLEPMPGATMVGTGPLADAMQPWQTAPPAHGGTYELLELTQTVQEGDQTVQVRRRRWIDTTTRLPVRELATSGAATDVEILFSYDRSRLEASELPSDTFAVEPADPNTPRRTRDYQTDPPQEPPPNDGEDSGVTYDQASTFRSGRALNADEAFVRSTLTDVSLAPSIARWGVPLTALELAELDARDAAADAMWQIDAWAAANAPGEYAGAWLDQAAGGLVRVGFTANAAARLPAIRQIFPFPDRLRTFDAQYSATQLTSLYTTASIDIPQLRAAGVDVSGIYEDVAENVVKVGEPTPTAAEQQVLTDRYGGGVVLEQQEQPADFDSELRIARAIPPIVGGLRIYPAVGTGCSSGFSMRGRGKWRILTAGHCADEDEVVLGAGGREIGEMAASARRGEVIHNGKVFGMDAGQVAVDPSWTRPHVYVHPGQPDALMRLEGQTEYERVPIGKDVCVVGYRATEPRCANLRSKHYSVPVGANDHSRNMIMMRQPTERKVRRGDSGGSVYNPRTETALGIVKGGTDRMVFVTPIYTVFWAWGTRVITG